MGIATIMVLLFHFRANFGTAPIDCFSSVGYGGVDIFLFLSGFGLYIGYKGNARYFYIRRFARIYPTYLLCAFLAYWQRGDFNPIRPIIASTGIGYYLPGFHIPIIDWYIPTMYLLYLLFPWFVSVEKIEPGGGKISIEENCISHSCWTIIDNSLDSHTKRHNNINNIKDSDIFYWGILWIFI